MKRLISLLLTAVLLIGLVPAWTLTARADVPTDLEATVRKQIEAYAASIAKVNSDEEAAVFFTKFAMNGKGAPQTLDENHHVTACLYSTNLLKEALTQTCSSLIDLMQRTGRTSIFGRGGVTWYSYGKRFACYPYLTSEMKPEEHMGTLFSMKSLYKSDYCPVADTPYDDTMLWTAGDTIMTVSMERTAATMDTVTYRVKVAVKDRFDFDGDYSKAKGDATFEKWLTLMGTALGKFMFKEYDWVSNSGFTLTVPNTCAHQTGNYHFSYNPDAQVFSSVAGDGLLVNPVTPQLYSSTNSTTGVTTSYYYHELDNTIRLRHDKPWVMEYTVKSLATLYFTPYLYTSSVMPYLIVAGRSYVYARQYERVKLTDAERDALGLKSNSSAYDHYYGKKTADLIKYSSKYLHTFRLENVIAPDGSNMVYFSVFNEDKQEYVLEPTAMNDYYCKGPGEKERSFVGQSDAISGMDFLINYIGCRGGKISLKETELKIWENGKAESSRDTFVASVVAPSCSAEGYTLHTCTLCGASYKTDAVETTPHSYVSSEIAPTCTTGGCTRYTCTVCGHSYDGNPISALGHSFGEWNVATNAACTAKGAEKRTCATCGHGETREIPALGHAYDSAVTPPGCTSEGYTTHTCTRCGNTYTDSKVGATGHSFGSWEIVTAPGCTTEGQEQHGCTVCGYSETRVVTATGHNHVAEVIAPTCTAAGKTIHTCACGDSYEDSYVPASGHSGGEATCRSMAKCASCGTYYGSRDPENHAGGTKVLGRVEPTETAEGYSGDTYCKGCDEKLSDGEILPVVHIHNLTKVDRVEPTQDTEGNIEYYICSCGKWFADENAEMEIEDRSSVVLPMLPPAEKCRYGDVNHDGKINITDAVLIMKHRAGSDLGDVTFCEHCANVDGREAVNVSDAVQIMKKRADENYLFTVEQIA